MDTRKNSDGNELNGTNTITVCEVRGKRTMAAPGVYGYDAEARVICPDGTELYVSVNKYDEFKHYTVGKSSAYDVMAGKTSVYDVMAGEGSGAPERDEAFEKWVASQFVGYTGEPVECPLEGDTVEVCGGITPGESLYLEYYTKLSETKASAYHKVFKTLQEVINRLVDGV